MAQVAWKHAVLLAKLKIASALPRNGATMPVNPIYISTVLGMFVSNLPRFALPFCVAGLLGLSACSPALNWRSVTLGELSVTLPCKPDRGERTVVLGSYSVKMEMVGCEADGALFAVSRVRLPEGVAAGLMQTQWQDATLQQMRANPLVASESKMSGTKSLPMEVIFAHGQRTNGEPLKANLVWLAVGRDLIHLAVYAEQLTQEQTQPFLEGIRAP